VLDAVRKDEAGPRLSRIRDVAPAVEVALAAERALKDSVKGKTLRDLVAEPAKESKSSHRHQA
jgi:membrane protein